jgi:tryptophan 2,3-dioxygenase
VFVSTRTSPAVNYSSYLNLDELLDAQRPRSDEHDELLFIVIHQVYELWFKQLLHELRALQQRLEQARGPSALHTQRRLLAILKTVVAQIDVLETMSPREFAGFRERLESGSGFQSAQFRELETVLGRRDPRVLAHHDHDRAARRRIAAAMERRPVFDSLLVYLAARGYPVPPAELDRDVRLPREPSEPVQAVLLEAYHDDGEEAQVCERLVDLDEGFQEWRYRHVKMVERTIGDKVGTGGSPGAAYLRTTLFKPAFPDLWAIRSRM